MSLNNIELAETILRGYRGYSAVEEVNNKIKGKNLPESAIVYEYMKPFMKEFTDRDFMEVFGYIPTEYVEDKQNKITKSEKNPSTRTMVDSQANESSDGKEAVETVVEAETDVAVKTSTKKPTRKKKAVISTEVEE